MDAKGSLLEAKGSLLDPKGSLLEPKGSLLDSKGSLLDPKGSLLKLKEVSFRPPKSILDPLATGSANESRIARMSHPEMVTFWLIWKSIGVILVIKMCSKSDPKSLPEKSSILDSKFDDF